MYLKSQMALNPAQMFNFLILAKNSDIYSYIGLFIINSPLVLGSLPERRCQEAPKFVCCRPDRILKLPKALYLCALYCRPLCQPLQEIDRTEEQKFTVKTSIKVRVYRKHVPRVPRKAEMFSKRLERETVGHLNVKKNITPRFPANRVNFSHFPRIFT